MSSKSKTIKRHNHLQKRKQKELKRHEKLKKKRSKHLEYHIRLQQYQEINNKQLQRLEQLRPSFDKAAFALLNNTIQNTETKTVLGNNKQHTGFNRNLWSVGQMNEPQ